MAIGSGLKQFQALAPQLQLRKLQESLPYEWIEEALGATGTASIKKRRLPAEVVVWLVIGMALMRDRAISAVVSALDLALPVKSGKSAAPSGISQARARLGRGPLAWLFSRSAEQWVAEQASTSTYRELKLFGADGTVLRVPDSPENRKHFGGHHNGKNESGYPLCRLVGLFSLTTHLLLDADFGPMSKGELTLAQTLWERLPQGSLVIVDRLFFNAPTLVPLENRNQQWLTRARERHAWRVVERLGENDELVEVELDRHKNCSTAQLNKKTWRFRVVSYQRKGFAPSKLCTSLLDPEKYPAHELVELYHQRWEIELAYDEIKTELLEREEALRSRTPEGIAQELWGLLLGFNLIRLEMARIAAEAEVPPTRISFVTTLQHVTTEWLIAANVAPGTIPTALARMRQELRRFILPERRSARSYPRQVKLQPRKYSRAPNAAASPSTSREDETA